jgi:signal transduction histidine kinase
MIGNSGSGGGGTGLGTTVCRKLIEDAGGAVRIESAPGAGTTVRLIVPRALPRSAK